MLINSQNIAHGGYSVFIKLVDFLSINLILILSGWLLKMEPFNTVISLSLLFSTSFLLLGEYTRFYQYRIKNKKLRSQLRLFATAFWALLFIEIIRVSVLGFHSLGYLSVLDTRFISATLFWYAIPLAFIYIIRLIIFKYSAKKVIRVAIIGITDNGVAVEQALREEYSDTVLDLAFYDERLPSRFGDLADKITSPFNGPVMNLVEEAKAGRIDEIYIALPLVALERIRHFLTMMSDTTVNTYIVPDFYAYSTNMSQLRTIHNLQTIGIFTSPFQGMGSFIKRTEDLVLGSIIMLMISPVLFAIGIGVKLTSSGPILFKQDRYGLSGQRIKVWKFRTMRVMENTDTVIQATKNDPRVTRFGSFLRRTSLDELPQFINVLQGSMSIVGPRPHAVTHNELYRKQVENYMIRHKVKPGITGLAQINGYRGEIDTLYKLEKRVQYDIEYIQNWSLWLDIKIIIKTIFKGFVGKNAY
ncbi:Putative colanic biosynthesis UDP-glucose lipid carrier transferase [Yersinia rohdei]|uniref:Putative colanic biosynthesis UDP-glucose lipid carrier transferase n=1 Tax=Yersinia rohdei TaxID=29485 RepID=A0A0U1HNJ5_YERRO|nr:undecaprenyl-phosphate glucose phosphotransferase [Yersinia rohdei]CQI88165.1 Putative colanic biosynthesis UDP-glucose lipid carrier transferase [Yersinia rohdei]